MLAGLHPELGAKGRVEFTIKGDGKQLAPATLNGDEPAHLFDRDLTGVTQLQLVVTSRGPDAKGTTPFAVLFLCIGKPRLGDGKVQSFQ